MSAMEYKGYKASAEYDAEDHIFHGLIHGITDSVSFEGESVEALERGFREAVDDYLVLCESIGKQPNRSYSGKLPLRMPEDLHRKVALIASVERLSVNAWIVGRLERATEEGMVRHLPREVGDDQAK